MSYRRKGMLARCCFRAAENGRRGPQRSALELDQPVSASGPGIGDMPLKATERLDNAFWAYGVWSVA